MLVQWLLSSEGERERERGEKKKMEVMEVLKMDWMSLVLCSKVSLG